ATAGAGTAAQIEAFLLGRGTNEVESKPKPPPPEAEVPLPLGRTRGATATARKTAARSRWSDWRAGAAAGGETSAGRREAVGGDGVGTRGLRGWDAHYEALMDHYRANGVGARIPPAEKQLGRWAREQIRNYKRNNLDETKVTLLRDIGFEFGEPPECSDEEIKERIKWLKRGTLEGDTPCDRKVRMLKRVKRCRGRGRRTKEDVAEDEWEERFERLKAYSENHGGDANISRDGDDGDEELWEWMREQQHAYRSRTTKKKHQPLSDERTARLEAIGLDLADNRTPRWEKNKHGNCYVPYSYKSERHGDLGIWVCQEKVRKCKGQMSNAQEARLAMLGFDFRKNYQWERYNNKRWEARLQDYIDHKAVHGGPPTTSKKSKNRCLGQWCLHQQDLFSMGNLQHDRLDRLKDAGFVFDVGRFIKNEEEWNKKLEMLIQYKSAHDGKDPSCSEGSLGHWCREQRSHFRKGTLQTRTDWNTRYGELKQFYLEHGHSNITSSDVHENLVRWVRKQRKRRSKLAEERLSKLLEIKFAFQVDSKALKESASKTWEQKYGQMVAFFESNGHCNVGNDNPSLARWFAAMNDSKLLSESRGKQLQRLLDSGGTKCSHESCEKYALLDDGLCRIHARKSPPIVDQKPRKVQPCKSSRWNSRYEELKQFYLDHGRIPIPSKAPHKSLCSWVGVQRWNHRESKLAEDRLSKLKEIGFSFKADRAHRDDKLSSQEEKLPKKLGFDCDPSVSSWDQKYEELKQFYFNHGRTPVPRKAPHVLSWIKTQRRNFRESKLAADQLSKLREIAFSFDDKRERQSKWEDKYNELAEFREAHGHCTVSKIHGKPSLYLWTQTQRKSYQKKQVAH
ncbi:hypothetical protein ACHAWF_008060, partial [Thalassiosira exigua]